MFTNKNQQTSWINDDLAYSLINISGLQPPKASIQCGSLHNIDGSVFLHSRVDHRNIVMTLHVLGDVEHNRKKLYHIFKIKQKGFLTITSSNKTVGIDAYCESIEVLPMSWPVRAMISLICPQPYFEDTQAIHIELASISKNVMFPLELDDQGIAFGSISPSTAINAYNTGDIDLGFKIRYQCVAPVENPKLININTGEYIQLQTDMMPGQIIEIHTELGQKKIEQIQANERISIFHKLKLGSTFFQLSEKDNVLFATSDLGASALMTEIMYRPKYSGI